MDVLYACVCIVCVYNTHIYNTYIHMYIHMYVHTYLYTYAFVFSNTYFILLFFAILSIESSTSFTLVKCSTTELKNSSKRDCPFPDLSANVTYSCLLLLSLYIQILDTDLPTSSLPRASTHTHAYTQTCTCVHIPHTSNFKNLMGPLPFTPSKLSSSRCRVTGTSSQLISRLHFSLVHSPLVPREVH